MSKYWSAEVHGTLKGTVRHDVHITGVTFLDTNSSLDKNSVAVVQIANGAGTLRSLCTLIGRELPQARLDIRVAKGSELEARATHNDVVLYGYSIPDDKKVDEGDADETIQFI